MKNEEHKRYESWVEFKEVLAKKFARPVPDKMWVLLRDVLLIGCVREPFDDGDIEFSIMALTRLMDYFEGEKQSK